MIIRPLVLVASTKVIKHWGRASSYYSNSLILIMKGMLKLEVLVETPFAVVMTPRYHLYITCPRYG